MKINYQKLVDQAKLKIVKEIISNIENKTGAHLNEIYITFLTSFPKIQMSNKLRQIYPNNMSVLICNNYTSIHAHDTFFEITLTFPTGMETLHIPFASITLFSDNTNQYAMKFIPEITEKIEVQDEKIVTINFNKN